jgi:hypothetical protein
MISKVGLSDALTWRARDRPAELPACCLHEMLRPSKPTLENVMTVPRASSIERARVDTRRSVDIQRRDDRSFRARQPKVVGQIKPHHFADSPKRTA